MFFSKNPLVSLQEVQLESSVVIPQDSPRTHIFLSSSLTITTSTLTLMILLFILYPNV
jgi:hypothetical protein